MSPVAVITGASRGLGEALSKRFWSAGYSIALIARSAEALERLQRDLPMRDGQRCWILPCDLAKPSDCNRVAGGLRSQLPHVDVLVNNAAIHGPVGPLWENDLSEWQQVLQVNLVAPATLCHAVVPLMRERGSGSIINLSGGGATGPRPNFSAYGTAKAALVRLSETLSEEVREFGIRVNCIAPGAMKTEMLREVLDKGPGAAGAREFEAALKVFSAGGASLDRVADLALFLASERSHGITGKLISAIWDNWQSWAEHVKELQATDAYTLRRITGRDRGLGWGDK